MLYDEYISENSDNHGIGERFQNYRNIRLK